MKKSLQKVQSYDTVPFEAIQRFRHSTSSILITALGNWNKSKKKKWNLKTQAKDYLLKKKPKTDTHEITDLKTRKKPKKTFPSLLHFDSLCT